MLINFIVTFIITVILMPIFIRFMRTHQFGQEIRDEGPAWHEVKSGTPTMGGTVFLMVASLVTVVSLLFNQQGGEAQAWLLVFALLFFAAIGFLDDFLIIFRKQNEGLKSGQKFVAQMIGSAVLVLLMTLMAQQVAIPLPMIGLVTNPLLVFVFLLIWITGFSNAFNLTDGLDGLSSGVGIVSFTTYAYLAYQANQADIAAFCMAVVGGLLGFIIFNVKPAKIFMGDVGSLALGAVLAVISVLLGNPWTLLLVGFIYIVETLSVILQVISFKTTGKRLFKMSPIHHHFEMLGWSEWRVVTTFWACQLLASIIAIILF
ncbi:phospho-N-acetylmuramoyl-pentapeptide-transferase [Aerococcus urinaehominis]|uniref:Phospho-N-acetylmuramoyl-pentapeptide-transferase n=1 Tax=Aerococcus urinaehominis TaxID=128944 RepID=A0A0X8FLT0_9LACT|nr:phospho-N-acetylmuramoyl-pentapeptide-transferase [Aerococcus urinaehominis]AMB99659.1 phospho-N-acetylmuramoyl-pentapeptide-transferase [Aerococcus urinaehominis]SDL89291.1 Phospho-N-acetylmuramoyl-pentapeptide-transferase [Aerococcus urinaehominis]